MIGNVSLYTLTPVGDAHIEPLCLTTAFAEGAERSEPAGFTAICALASPDSTI